MKKCVDASMRASVPFLKKTEDTKISPSLSLDVAPSEELWIKLIQLKTWLKSMTIHCIVSSDMHKVSVGEKMC